MFYVFLSCTASYFQLHIDSGVEAETETAPKEDDFFDTHEQFSTDQNLGVEIPVAKPLPSKQKTEVFFLKSRSKV